MTHWTERFIGVPFEDLGRTREGCDCWGLACIVYSEELGITLPDYLGYSSTDERGELAAIISGATASPLWVPLSGPAISNAIAGPESGTQSGDAVFRRGALDTHVGLVVHHGLMMHIARDDCAKIESYRGGAWAHRLSGIYRHVELVSRAPR